MFKTRFVFFLVFLSKLALGQEKNVLFCPNEYVITKEAISFVEKKHYQEFTFVECVSKIIDGLNEKLDLNVKYKNEIKTIVVFFDNKSFSIVNPNSSDLIELFEVLKPAVESKLKSFKISINYEVYLCNLLLSEIRGSFYTSTMFNNVYRENYLGHFKYIRSKHDEIVVSHTVYDEKQNPIIAGSKIIEINNIPIKVLTESMIDSVFYINKDAIVNLKAIRFDDTTCFNYKNSSNQTLKDVLFKIYSDSIYFIKIQNFGPDVVQDIKSNFKKDSAKISHVIIDLRECPGGQLTQVIDAIGLFVEKGKKIAEFKGRNEEIEYATKESPIFRGQSITIFTDSLTAAGSEAFVYSLKKIKRAKIIGERTQGRGPIRRYFYINQRRFCFDMQIGELIVLNTFKLNTDFVEPDILLKGNISIQKMISLINSN